MTSIEFERRIKAPREVVFRYLVDPELWMKWQGIDADLDPRPGGVHRVNIIGDGFASGNYVEVVEPSRVVFTWGFEYPDNPLRPGSTLVEIDLFDEPPGTRLRFRQSDIPDGFDDQVPTGWAHYLDRLVLAAAGSDPGVDPMLVETG